MFLADKPFIPPDYTARRIVDRLIDHDAERHGWTDEYKENMGRQRAYLENLYAVAEIAFDETVKSMLKEYKQS